MSLPKTLLDARANGTLVPFAGAGVSMAVRTREGKPAFPSWWRLLELAAKRLADEDRPQHKVVEALLNQRPPATMDAARYAKEGLGALWSVFLRDVFDPPRASVDDDSLDLARAIWELGSKLVVTTNYDRVLRWACPNSDELDEVSIQAGDALTKILRRQVRDPMVWHLHGTIVDPTQIILAPDGYQLLYSNVEQERLYTAALTALRSLMISHHFLFIGFSLDDEFLIRQFERVHEIFAGSSGPHYVVARMRDVGAMRSKVCGLDVQFIEFDEFEDLRGILHEMAGTASSPSLSARLGKLASAGLRSARRITWPETSGHDMGGPWATFRVGECEQRMRWISPGKFTMGSAESEQGRYDSEGPGHEVTLTRGYWLADTSCTQALWATVMGSNPSEHTRSDRLPVDRVSWADIQIFLGKLNGLASEIEAKLPTEAQWEYACRAGCQTPTYAGLDAIAWYEKNSARMTHEVGQKLPNAWGLYDMLGNVSEWCEDSLRTYEIDPVVDPVGQGEGRVYRGGSWLNGARRVRAAFRSWYEPDFRDNFLGFRLTLGGR